MSARWRAAGDRLGRLWPTSALLAWLGAWLLWQHARTVWSPTLALALSIGWAALAGALHQRPWRRLVVALGWPLALAVLQVPVPTWAWLIAALVLLLAYPLRLWRDAPLFHTPRDAFEALRGDLQVPAGARLLDAGCGTGAGLRALRSAFPQAVIEGVEASPLLALWARGACRFARVHRGDLWRHSWSGYRLVYLFQRPESMAPALHKARAELDAGAWLLSLDFPLPGVPALREWPVGRHRLYLYPRDALK